MERLAVVTMILVAGCGIIQCGPESSNVRELCEEILLQSKEDANQCFEKPLGYKIKGDKAALIVFCCLGYFNDVTHNYQRYLTDDFGQFIANMTSNKYFLSIGRFVMMCKNEAKRLNSTDFLCWYSKVKTSPNCSSC